MPRDTAILTEIGNAIFARAARVVDFLHLPVPRERDDVAYFTPLRELRLPATTRLYLGLIHWDDAAGDRRRIDTARTVIPDFGVASECGWGRTDPTRLSGHSRKPPRGGRLPADPALTRYPPTAPGRPSSTTNVASVSTSARGCVTVRIVRSSADSRCGVTSTRT